MMDSVGVGINKVPPGTVFGDSEKGLFHLLILRLLQYQIVPREIVSGDRGKDLIHLLILLLLSNQILLHPQQRATLHSKNQIQE